MFDKKTEVINHSEIFNLLSQSDIAVLVPDRGTRYDLQYLRNTSDSASELVTCMSTAYFTSP